MLNEVANGILGTHAALGVLAIETANVWAREMGVSLADLVTDAREQINGVWGFGQDTPLQLLLRNLARGSAARASDCAHCDVRRRA